MICICGHTEEVHQPTEVSTYCNDCYKELISGIKEIKVDSIWHKFRQDNLKYLENLSDSK